MILRILLLTLLPLLSYAQINSKEAIPRNTQSNDKGPVELKRNALYNLEEIKVRWKKAALENLGYHVWLLLLFPVVHLQLLT